MSFVVDTDICSKFLKGDRQVFNRFIQHSGGIYISSITLAELYTWVYRIEQSNRLHKLESLLKSAPVIAVDTYIAQRCGHIRSLLLNQGITIEVPDLLIAATALEFDYTLVTHNTSHFSAVPGLRLQDWLIM